MLWADDEFIEVGDGSYIQDGTVIYEDHDMPVLIGRNTSVGHATIIHSCRNGDESLIGNGAIVLDGEQNGNRCIVAAGTLVTPNARIADDGLIMGNPGKRVRSTTERDLALVRRAASHYQGRCEDRRRALVLRTPACPPEHATR